MGNTFGSNGFSNWFEPTCLVIQESQVVVHEGDEPYFIAHLLDADILPGESLAEVDLSFAHANAPAAGDGDISVVKRVVEIVEPAIRAR